MAQKTITVVALREGSLEWATLKQTKTGVEVAARDQVSLAGEAGADWDTAEAAAVIKKAWNAGKGEVGFALPSAKILMRVVDLPTADPVEMRSMAELQVDKFSPFPVEHMAIAIEKLAQKDNSSRVLIAAVQREIIGKVRSLFDKTGLVAHAIDVQVMGWWRLLVDHAQVPEHGRQAFLLMDKTGIDLLICEDRVPVVIRSLGTAQGVSEEEFFSEITDEISLTLTTLEAERGTVAATQVEVWHWGGEPPSRLMALIHDACLIEVAAHSFDSLQPLSEGLARRLFEGETTILNLAPAEWREEEQTRHARTTLLTASLFFLLVWGIGVGGFWGGLELQRAKLAKLKSQVAQIEAPAETARQLRLKVQSFEQYADRTYSALECLREVSALLTPGIDLTQFNYTKGESVSVRGDADSTEPIYQFYEAMGQSKLFSKTKPEAVRSRAAAGGVQKQEFSIAASLPESGEEKP